MSLDQIIENSIRNARQKLAEGWNPKGTKAFDDKSHVGSFKEHSKGHHFDYSHAKEGSWGHKHGLPHVVHVGTGGKDSIGSETRAAHVKKTVAHVAVDENPDGTPKIEKWKLKKHYKHSYD